MRSKVELVFDPVEKIKLSPIYNRNNKYFSRHLKARDENGTELCLIFMAKTEEDLMFTFSEQSED